ncbi:MAG: DUF2723 domain-containing protein [Candidatus Sumerlaeota bacterium]|nr:DUF2723 domain-containing protein [Candidatus Sumerlaeota bacterium]
MRRIRPLLFLLIALAAAAVLYGRTICPTAFWGDGLELTAAAACLGVAHPTGYPLFVLLGHLFLALPFGDPGLRMNLLSAACALLAAGLLFGLMGEVWRLACPQSDPCCWTALAWRAGVALSFALSRFLWQEAVLTEVYSAMAAAQIGCLWLAVRTCRTPSRRNGLALAFLYGIAFECHLLAIVLAPMMGVALWRSIYETYKTCTRSNRRAAPVVGLLAAAALCFLVGLSGYLELPLRARADPPMNWGDPSTPARLIAHVSGGQFKQTKVLSVMGSGKPLRRDMLREYLVEQTRRILGWPIAQFSPDRAAESAVGLAMGAMYWLFALAGAALWIRRDWALGLGALGMLACGVGVLIVYTIPDIEAYFLSIWPLFLALFWTPVLSAVCFPWPLRARKAESPTFRRNAANRDEAPDPEFRLKAGLDTCHLEKPNQPLFILLALVPITSACCMAAWLNFPQCDLSHYREATAYGRRLMDALPPNALLLTGDDNTIFSAWYQQVVEGRRPDVAVYGLNFIFLPWYRAYLKGAEERGLSLYVGDRPPSGEADWIVAVGGGVIIPNIDKVPVCAALSDPWQQSALLPNWRAQFVADLADPESPKPPIFHAPAAPRLYRLSDNPEYRAYQEKQFAEMYGKR